MSSGIAPQVLPQAWRVVYLSSMRLPWIVRIDATVRSLGHEPVAIVTTSRGGRSKALRVRALGQGARGKLAVLTVRHPQELADVVRPLDPDIIFCAGLPWRIPTDVLMIPRLGIVNCHPSLLPRYRGPIPLAWTLRNGDEEVGLTYHLMDQHFDSGPILAQASSCIGEEDQFKDLFWKLDALAARTLPGVFTHLALGGRGDPQSESGASVAGFFESEYAFVDWSRPRWEIHNQVRAWRAVPQTSARIQGPLTDWRGQRVRLLRTSLRPAPASRVIEASDGPLFVLEAEPAEG